MLTCVYIFCVLILWFSSLHTGLYSFLPPDSREFEDLVKIVSSCYLDSSSRGAFSYCKARLIHNELLEKEVGSQPKILLAIIGKFWPLYLTTCGITFVRQFIEKRREMKQEGRTEQELTESFCFLYPDKSKVFVMDMLGCIFLSMNLSFLCSLVCPAPVDLWKGAVSWTLQDYDTRKSNSGWVGVSLKNHYSCTVEGFRLLQRLNAFEWNTLCDCVSLVSVGVYLSKYSDLLQINPFEAGSSGDVIIFKVMRVWLPFCHVDFSRFPGTSSSSTCFVS